ncbi:phage tail assembly chaperone [Silvimonas soli]|uniref:phage tail assembly chaperone n=1 Tax=Silvimonas soli TaxID=2980100 RepID=UPI0024B36130|nr:hypothetical protein [Silvimonas soli]
MEFELNGVNYRAGKLTAFEQFHVSRKIAPIVPTLIPIFLRLSKAAGDKPLTENLAEMGEILQPFADGIASMPDSDAEYVLGTCLSVVQRQQGGNWSVVWNKQHNTSMFDDMDIGVMLPIAVRVIRDSLGGFINGLLTSQTGSPGAA